MVKKVSRLDKVATPGEMLAALGDDLGEGGFQTELDANHIATFIARGPKLLVTFELAGHTIAASPDGMPLGLDFVEDKNCSLLQMTARKETWFRNPCVYEFMDRLVDDMFFEDFEQVLFYGAGTGAYSACAFSVAAPGATVVAISPQATLDTSRAGWDHRFPAARRFSFDDRYGYAPDMLEGAGEAFVLFDPYQPLDHIHASLFRGPNVTRLACRHFGGAVERGLREMDLLHQVIELASVDHLSAHVFFDLLRKRRTHGPYLRSLLQATGRRGNPLRVALLCDYVLRSRQNGPVFRRNLNAATTVLAKKGTLPDWLAEPETPEKS